MTADFAIDRARVEARAAANAAEQFALLASENPRPTRVDQNVDTVSGCPVPLRASSFRNGA